MAGLRMIHAGSLSVSSLLTITTIISFSSPPAFAVGEIIDGLPTAAACQELGFKPFDRERDMMRAPGLAYPPSSPGTMMQQLPSPFPQPPATADAMTRTFEAAPSGAVMPHGNLGGYIQALPHDTERYPDATLNPIRTVTDAPVSTFSIDVDTASYSNVRRFLADGHLPPRDAVRVEELVNYFDYAYPRPESVNSPFSTYVAVTPSPWAPDKAIVHIGVQGFDVAPGERPPLNLVFLVDVSGSMEGPDRLPLAKKALNILVDQLRPEDRIGMVVYAGAAGVVLESTQGTEKLKMRCAIEFLEAGGSTAGGEGLALAYKTAERHPDENYVSRVVLLTDGDFNVGIDDPEKLEDFVAEKRKDGTYLSVYGFGRGNYNDVMMQTLAQSGNGIASYVDSIEEAQRLFHTDFARNAFPIADDVKIQVEFNPAHVAEYRLIGYETRMLNREDFNNDAVDAGEVGTGASVTALYEITPAGGQLSSDPLRYQERPANATLLIPAGELAYVKIRYKLPGEGTSTLIETPIRADSKLATVAAASDATRWAIAVAAYGQRLRGDPYMGDGFGWDDIAALARPAVGSDPTGERAEFMRLVETARTASSVNQ